MWYNTDRIRERIELEWKDRNMALFLRIISLTNII